MLVFEWTIKGKFVKKVAREKTHVSSSQAACPYLVSTALGVAMTALEMLRKLELDRQG